MDTVRGLIISFFVGVVFLAAAFPAVPNVYAQSMHGLEELELAEPYSLPYAGQALWFDKWFENLGPYHSSAVRINECWAITAGHAVLVNGYYAHTLEVGNGPNALTNRGAVREIAEVQIHPSWEAGGGVWNGTRIDLALLRFAQPLPGQNLEIASLSLNEHFDYAGYARPATPDLGLLPYDGERRAWEAKAHHWGFPAGGISESYVRSSFYPGELPLGGVVTGGSSGSGGFNELGELVSLAVYGSGSPNYMGRTYGVRLGLPEIKDWIESYISDLSCVRSPPVVLADQVIRVDALSICWYGQGC